MSVRFSKFIIKTWIQQANDSCQRVIRNQIIKLANAETEQVSGYEIRKKNIWSKITKQENLLCANFMS